MLGLNKSLSLKEKRLEKNKMATSSSTSTSMSIPASSQSGRNPSRQEGSPSKKSKKTEIWWKEEFVNVLLDEIMDENFEHQNYRISAIILNVKANNSKRTVNTYFSKKEKGGTNAFSSEITYDRIFVLGCLGTDTCFSVISRSNKQSAMLLGGFIDDHKRKPCVGHPIVILEPIYTERTLGKDNNLPIFDVKRPFEPYDFPKIPEQKYEVPRESITKYFILHKMSIQVNFASMQKSSCTSYLCDKQVLRGQDKNCCCFFNSGTSPLVLEAVVKVFDPESENEMIISTPDFRSWNFSNLVIDGLNNVTATLDDFGKQNEKLMRNSIKGIVDYVNENDGWTVIGWLRRGTQVDASSKGIKTTEDEITAESVHPHIIKLFPTRVKLAELAHRRYKKVYPRVDLV